MRKPKVISSEEVKHIARLCKIEVTEREEKLFTSQLNDVLRFFKAIEEVETTLTPPTFHVSQTRNVLRDDTVGACLPREKAMRNAKKKEDGFFKAPRIA
jgi:aspartyl-tRNA(Asn)/glutamyl-tRNA(Gln) amidotransferase subunit C